MELKHFWFWCQKVLPLVYDDSLSYYEVLCKCVKYINELIDQDKIFADEIDALKTEMSVVKAYVDRIVAGYVGEKIIFVGDSYGGSSRVSPWPTIFATQAGLNENQYINVCQGGIGWTEGENGHNFKERLEHAYSLMQDPPYEWVNTEVTKIIVAGGVFRDLNVADFNYNTLRTLINNRISSFMTYAREHFPNAKVYYAYCNCCLNYGISGNMPDYWQSMLNNVFNYYYKASEYGYIFLPNLRYVLMENYKIDTSEPGMLHPSNLGGIALGTAIHNAVYGCWSDDVFGSVSVNAGADNESANCRIRITSENASATLLFRDAANVPIDNRALQEYTICTLPDQLQNRGVVNTFTNVVGIALAKCYTNETLVATMPVEIVGDGLSLKAKIDGAYTAGYTKVVIEPFNLACDRARLFENKIA